MAPPRSVLDLVMSMQEKSQNEALQAWQRILRAPKVAADAARDVSRGTSPHDVVYEERSLKLLRYRNDRPAVFAEPIVICFALVNRPYILDLQADRSVVRQLLRCGFDVYLIDWGIPRDSDHTLELYDYVCGYMKNVVDFVLQQSGAAQVNLLGYCMGGTMSTMFTSLYQPLVRNLIVMAAPIDFSTKKGLLNVWSDEKYFDVDGFVDAFGNCPGSFLQACFQMMKPVQNFIEKYIGFFDKMDDDKFVESFFAMEYWGHDNIPVAGETFRQFVKMLYQQNKLVKGEMSLRDRAIALQQITCPLLILVAVHDHMVTLESALALRDHVKSTEIEEMRIDAGHVGLAVSSRAHREFWPGVASWIADRSSERRQPSHGN